MGEALADGGTAHAEVQLSIIDQGHRLTTLGHASGEVDPDQIGGLHPIDVDEPGTCGEPYHLTPLTNSIIARVWESDDAQQVLRRELPAQLA